MSNGSIRHAGTVLWALAWSVFVAACSERGSDSAPRATPPLGAAAPGAEAAQGRPSSRAQPPPKKAPATGPAREHPFAPVVDARARRRLLATKTGPLILKAVLAGPDRAAIIRQGSTDHLVRQGDRIGTLTVVAIHKDEVVVGSGKRKQVLLLYER